VLAIAFGPAFPNSSKFNSTTRQKLSLSVAIRQQFTLPEAICLNKTSEIAYFERSSKG